MNRILPIILITILFLSACGPEKGIEVHSAWARPAVAGGNGGVYFEINNFGTTADELIGASSDVAEVVEIHQSKMEGDVMKMEMLSSLPIEAKSNVTFKPGGSHVMLFNLKRELNLNDTFEVILQFKNHEAITIHVTVKESAPED